MRSLQDMFGREVSLVELDDGSNVYSMSALMASSTQDLAVTIARIPLDFYLAL